jgi:hypothetical protein
MKPPNCCWNSAQLVTRVGAVGPRSVTPTNPATSVATPTIAGGLPLVSGT